MSNKGIQITATQNTDANIRLLAAQKEMYSTAKKLFIVQCLIVGPLAIIVSLFSALMKNILDDASIFEIYTVFALVAELILEERITVLKKGAASIQEVFDHNVLDIHWNNTLIPQKPDAEIIFKYFQRFSRKQSLNKFYDWYSPQVNRLNTNLATVICQRTNCTYDFSLRKKFTSAISIIAFTVLTILFLISVSAGITMKSFSTQILLPFAPIFVLAWKQVSFNKSSIKNLSDLKNLIEGILSNATAGTIVNEITIRQIQDKIYYNRILSPLLPDKIFDKLRKSLEEGMHFSASEKILELETRN